MRKTFAHGAGGVLSADIAVRDHERELKFYKSILTTGESPLWRDDLMNNLGAPVIGLGERTPEYENLPLQWMPHFQVADVAASAACTIKMGGKELMHSQTDDGQSQWAVLVDPGGAAFGVIPVVAEESNSTTRDERVGCISWLSLIVPDALPIRDFYQDVIGWGSKSIESLDNAGQITGFEMLRNNDVAAAEICQYRSEHKGIPPVWLIHLPVGDLAKSLSNVGEGGGEVVKEFAEEQYAIVRDPAGVYLALGAG